MVRMVVDYIIPAAMSVMPPHFDTPGARAMIVAIGLQESRFDARRQREFGPARGFYQFEKAGVRGVMDHPASKLHLNTALRSLCYDHLIGQANHLHAAIEHNDVLATVFARLLLRTLPGPLPGPGSAESGWSQYLAAWRPGKPHQATWDDFYDRAWILIDSGSRFQ